MAESFKELYQGRLEGFLFEKQYDAFVDSLSGNETWYRYEFANGDLNFSETTMTGVKDQLLEFRHMISARKQHNTFPFTYVHNTSSPNLIKVYDPIKCGSSCSLTTPDPWWIFTRIRPEMS